MNSMDWATEIPSTEPEPTIRLPDRAGSEVFVVRPFVLTPRLVVALLLIWSSFVLLPLTWLWAAGPAGEYLKDDRWLDELGRTARIVIREAPDGQIEVEMIIANPALCGGALGGTVPLKGRTAVVEDGECRLTLTLTGDTIQVTGDQGHRCQGSQCPWNGAYIRQGARVKPADQVIKEIRRHYDYINAHLDQEPMTKEVTWSGAGLGTLTAFRYMDYLKKLVLTRNDPAGGAEMFREEYYFWNNQLLFAFHRSSADHGRIIEERFYFDQDHLIRWLDREGRNRPTNDPEFAAARDRILARVARLRAGAEGSEARVDLEKPIRP